MAGKLKVWFVDGIARSLRLPHKGLFGWIACKFFVRKNGFLETNAVRLSNIKPDHRVLEIGFGPGLGLEAAYNIVKDGKGKVFGVDTSLYMVETARRRLKKGVRDSKVMLYHASATQIPLNTDSVHRVFHCNCYYFWPSMRAVMREIYRVMQPGSTMITTLNIASLKKTQERGFLKFAHPDPVKYMRCLENYGFENVRLEYHSDPVTGKQFEAIYSEVLEKPAHDKSMYSDDEDEELDQLQQMHQPKIDHSHMTESQLSEHKLLELKKNLDFRQGTEKS